MDVSVALLTHMVQRERGVSCGYCACGGSAGGSSAGSGVQGGGSGGSSKDSPPLHGEYGALPQQSATGQQSRLGTRVPSTNNLSAIPGGGSGAGAGAGGSGASNKSNLVFDEEMLMTARKNVDAAARECGREVPHGISVLRDIVDCVPKSGNVARARASQFYSVLRGYTSEIKVLLNVPSQISGDTWWAFAQLKEATGFERALLTGVLSCDEDSLRYLPTNVLSDFVMCVHQQRTMARILERSNMTEELRSVIAPALAPPIELTTLRARLEASFNVRDARGLITADRWWTLVTMQIDKMEEAMAAVTAATTRSKPHAVEAVQMLLTGNVSSTAPRSVIDRCKQLVESTMPETLRAELIKRLAEYAHALEPQANTNAGEFGVPTVGLYELRFERKIGDGVAAQAYEARLRGMRVAVKVAKGDDGTNRWQREVSALNKLRHPNIVQCYGVVSQPPVQCLVLEFCSGGDIRTLLDSGQPLPQGFVCNMARGIAEGMNHLHSTANIMHRDLKSANVLLNDAHVPKITDFGVSSAANARMELTAETGTYRWMAPEVAQHQPYAFPADVYSFGMIVFELITHNIPFQDRSAVLAAVSAINGDRPPLPPDTPRMFVDLVQGCLHADAVRRPTFPSIANSMDRNMRELTVAELAWLDAQGGHSVYGQPVDVPMATVGEVQRTAPPTSMAPAPAAPIVPVPPPPPDHDLDDTSSLNAVPFANEAPDVNTPSAFPGTPNEGFSPSAFDWIT